jgi:hypothetical protein
LLNADNDLIMIGSLMLLGEGQTVTERLIFVFSPFRNGSFLGKYFGSEKDNITEKIELCQSIISSPVSSGEGSGFSSYLREKRSYFHVFRYR